jgi:putative acetyltransferase
VVSLVAIEEDRVVGHILFSPVTIASGDKTVEAIGLAPMAVLPEWQNRGIGSQLVNAGLAECRKAGYKRAIVLGHPEFYPRFGFVPASRFGVTSEYNVRDEVFMAMELEEDALQDCPGLATYQPEFNEV